MCCKFKNKKTYWFFLMGGFGFNPYQAPQLNVSELDCSMRLNTIHVYHEHMHTCTHANSARLVSPPICVYVCADDERICVLASEDHDVIVSRRIYHISIALIKWNWKRQFTWIFADKSCWHVFSIVYSVPCHNKWSHFCTCVVSFFSVIFILRNHSLFFLLCFDSSLCLRK